MKILVTGGAGYLGSVLVPVLLAEGHEVTVIDNFMYDQASLLDCCHQPGLLVIRGDARDRALIATHLKGADAIIPLACLTGAPLCDQDPAEARSVNLDAIRMLLGEAGFVIERMTYFNTFLLPGVALMRWLERVWKRPRTDHGETVYGELDFQERFPQWIERCCEAILASEAGWLRSRSFPAGVSIGVIARA